MVIGIIISVATLTVALSIFEGYEKVLKKTILGVNSHIYVFKSGEGNLTNENIEELNNFFADQSQVESTGPVIMSQAMASNRKKIKGCLIRGINWEQEEQPTSYRKFITDGTYELSNYNDAVIGEKLAKHLNIELGDSLKLISTLNSEITPVGLKPKEMIFRVAGLYRSGMYEYDLKYVFMNYRAASELTSIEDEYSMLEVKLDESAIENADFLAYRWSYDLDEQNQDHNYQISSWIDFNGNLFSLLKLEKWVIFIILSFLILIASFNVVSSVSTAIIEKKYELGILKAYGASNKLLREIFIGKTLIISFIAITFGQIMGVLISVFLSEQTFFLLKGDVYFLEKINIDFNLISWLIILVVSLLIVICASILPLKRISGMEVNDILRS